MSTTQIDKLKKLAAADSTPEEIRKELIEILLAQQSTLNNIVNLPYLSPLRRRMGEHITLSGSSDNWVVE